MDYPSMVPYGLSGAICACLAMFGQTWPDLSIQYLEHWHLRTLIGRQANIDQSGHIATLDPV